MSLLPDITINALSRLRQRRGQKERVDPRNKFKRNLHTSTSSAGNLIINSPAPTLEETLRKTHQSRGQFLARQDRWAELAAEMRLAETAQTATPSGTLATDLLSYGARCDVVLAAEHALYDGQPARDASLLAGIEALEAVLAEAKHDLILATVVANAHIDIAAAWHGTKKDHKVPQRHHDAFNYHFTRASDIIEPFQNSRAFSPTLAAVKCALHATGQTHSETAISDYEALIDFDPYNPRVLRAFGRYLADHPALEQEARRTAARTHKIVGSGAYTWMMLDAACRDDLAEVGLDVELFIQGLHDILTCTQNQHTVNFLASFCAITVGRTLSDLDFTASARLRISACARWIVHNHLTELHPIVWANAEAGLEDTFRSPGARGFAAAGKAAAMCTLESLFKHEIAAGCQVIFTVSGPIVEPRHPIRNA